MTYLSQTLGHIDKRKNMLSTDWYDVEIYFSVVALVEIASLAISAPEKDIILNKISI